jgi:replication factor C subunit 2/4
MFDKLSSIAKSEGIEVDDSAIESITNISNGDMRKGIMLLQNLKYLDDTTINNKSVDKIAGCISDKLLNSVINICVFDKTDNIPKIINIVNRIKSYSYPIQNVINALNYLIIKMDEKCLTDRMKADICLHFAITEKRLIDGADEYLQLLSIFMCIKSVVMGMDTVYKN